MDYKRRCEDVIGFTGLFCHLQDMNENFFLLPVYFMFFKYFRRNITIIRIQYRTGERNEARGKFRKLFHDRVSKECTEIFVDCSASFTC